MNTGEMKIKDYLEELSGKAPVPGGGGVCGLAGALSASLGQMVCSLTMGKKKFASIEGEVSAAFARLQESRVRLLELADRDAEVFLPLSGAYSMPADTESEKEAKQTVMEACLKAAASVPCDIMNTVCHMLEDVAYIAVNGSRLAVSDAANAAALSRAVIASCLTNIRINTKLMHDRDHAEATEKAARALYADGIKECDRIYDIVMSGLWGETWNC